MYKYSRKEFLKLYFAGKLEHTYETLEGLEKMRKAGFIKYVHEVGIRGYWTKTIKGKRFLE